MGLIGQLKTNVNVYERLIDGGCADDDIPGWVIRTTVDDDGSRLRTPVEPTENTYIEQRKDPNVTHPGQASPTQDQREPSNMTVDASTPLTPAQYAGLDQLNAERLAQQGLLCMPNGPNGKMSPTRHWDSIRFS